MTRTPTKQPKSTVIDISQDDVPDHSQGEMVPEVDEVDDTEILTTDLPLDADTPFLSIESRAEVMPEQHRKAGTRISNGRPSGKDGAPPGSASTVPVKVPDPKYKTYYSDSDNPAQRTKAFWNWWNNLPMVFKERCDAYVYRDWPVLIQLDKETTDELICIDKISGVEPVQTDNDLNDKYGAGDFHIYFNETLKPGKRNLCMLYVKGSRDLKSRPPSDRRISDPNQIEMTDPANKSYIEYLRMRGILPDQITLAKKEGEMASLQAAQEMSATVNKLTDKVIEMAQDRGQNSPGADESLKVLTQASINANQIQADAAKRSNEMLHDTIRSLREMEGGHGSGDTLTIALQLAKELAGPRGADNDELAALRARLEKVQDEKFAMLMEMVKDAKGAAPAGGSPFGNLKEGFAAMKEIQGILSELNPKPSVAEEVADAVGLPPWAQMALQHGLPILGNIVQAIMVGRGLATPAPVVQPPQQPTTAQQQPIQPQGYPMPGNAATPPSNVLQMQPAGIGAPVASAIQNYGLPQDVAELLYEIKTPLIRYINSDATGADYADLFTDNYSVEDFRQIQMAGADGLVGAITSFPPITDKLNALGIGMERLRKFAEEFVAYVPDKGEEVNDNVEVIPDAAG